MKIRTILVDDAPENISYLSALLMGEKDFEVVGSYLNAEELLTAEPQPQFDACFLDIQMPGMDGLSLAQILKEKVIVLVSAHKELASEAFDVKAVDFVPKPIKVNDFKDALDRVRQAIRSQPKRNTLVWQTPKGKSVISVSDILLIENSEDEPRDKILTLKSGQERTLKNITLEQLTSEFLHRDEFLQVNRQVIIHRSVFRILMSKDSIQIELPDHSTRELTLSRTYAAELKKHFNLE